MAAPVFMPGIAAIELPSGRQRWCRRTQCEPTFAPKMVYVATMLIECERVGIAGGCNECCPAVELEVWMKIGVRVARFPDRAELCGVYADLCSDVFEIPYGTPFGQACKHNQSNPLIFPSMPESKNSDLGITRERTEARPDFSKDPLPKKPLPASLQETLNNEEKLWSTMYEGKYVFCTLPSLCSASLTFPRRAGDSTESDMRYAGYAARVKTILKSASRYVAYTSDIGESFRPVAHPWLVRGSYAISWAYLGGDVANEGRKAYLRNQEISPASIKPIDDYRTVMAERAVFQSLASMGIPALTIHSIVKYTGRALKKSANKTLRTWGPIALGLSAVPFLPFVLDEPVEHTVKYVFHKGFAAFEKTEVAGPGSEKKEL